MSDTENTAADEASSDPYKDGVLPAIMNNRGQTNEEDLKALLEVVAKQCNSGTVEWSGNLTHTIGNAVDNVDRKISRQLSKVLSCPELRELEGSWRGMEKLIRNSEVGSDLKIRIYDATPAELLKQFESAPAVDRSPLFNTVYQKEYGTAGGEPYGLLVGDMSFTYKDQDVTLLRYMGEVAAASHCPFIAATSASMFELPAYSSLAEGRPVSAGFDDPLYGAWNAFRASDDSRYVTLTLPRVMARLPYGNDTLPVKNFRFEELEVDENRHAQIDQEKDFVWSNAAYELALNMTQAFTEFGWCTAIRGVDNGGKVENLPNFTYLSESGDRVQLCPR